MTTTEQLRERRAGREFAATMADELASVSPEYAKAFVQELMQRFPKVWILEVLEVDGE